MRLTAEFNNLYVGEHNSEKVTAEIDKDLSGKNIRLAFFTPSGKNYVSENLTVTENKADYLLPCRLLDCPGVLYVQILVYDGDVFIKKSRVYEYNVLPCADFHPSSVVPTDGLITPEKLQDDINEIIKLLRSDTQKENKAIKKNSRVQAAQIAGVARSYYDNRGTTGAYNFTYSTKTCFDQGFDPSSDTGIDCSAFIGLVLRGIPFDKSPYKYVIDSAGINDSAGDEGTDSGNNTDGTDSGDYDYKNVAVNEGYPWAVDLGKYSYPVKSGAAAKPLRTASQIAEWMNDMGYSVKYDDTFYDIEIGDIIFWAKKRNGEYIQPERYKRISHIAICTNKIYVSDYDKTKIYQTGEYCYHPGNDSNTEGLYRCVQATTGEFDSVMWNYIGKHRYRHTTIEATAAAGVILNQTLEINLPEYIVMAARPDLGALSNGEFTGNITDGKGITNLDKLTDDCFTYITAAVTQGLPDFVKNVPKNGNGYAVEVRKTYTKSGFPYSVIQTIIDTRHNNEICVRTKYLSKTEGGTTKYLRPDDPNANWTSWSILVNKYMLDKVMSHHDLGELKVDATGEWFIDGGRIFAQINADWEAKAGVSQILNKPDLKKVATSGSYKDLEDKPTIPAAQVNADWNATSGKAQILHKPELKAVATSGSFDDLSNVPIMMKMKLQAGNSIDSGTDFDTLLTPDCRHIDNGTTYKSCSNTPYSECTISEKSSDDYLNSGGNLYIIKIGATVEGGTKPLRYKQIFIPRLQRCGEYYMRHIEISQDPKTPGQITKSAWYMFLPHKKAEDITLDDFNI